MELQHRWVHAADDLRDLRGVGIHKKPYRLHKWRQCVPDLRRAFGGEISRARRIEDESDRVRARVRRGSRIAGPRDAADLDARSHPGRPHFASYSTRSRYKPSAANVGAALFRSRAA